MSQLKLRREEKKMEVRCEEWMILIKSVDGRKRDS
jgi:hypothetical protein